MMAYKRTSRKSGNFRTTKTYNTNGNVTNTTSHGSTKKGGTVFTTSHSSKGGMKQTMTYKDGAGYVHHKTLYKSKSAAQLNREAKQRQKAWSSLFGGSKKTRTKKRSGSSNFIAWILIATLVLVVISSTH